MAFYYIPERTLPNAISPLAGYDTQVLLKQYPLCAAPAVPAPAAVVINPTVIATQFWQTIPLPIPRPSIPPGFAVTGKPAYLVTGGTVAPRSWTDITPIGPLTVTAHGSYVIGWGDGTTSGPFLTEGLAYPGGNISHTYDNTGTVTVSVTERWTATWRLGRAGGVLRQLQTIGRIAGFPLRQVQAVVLN